MISSQAALHGRVTEEPLVLKQQHLRCIYRSGTLDRASPGLPLPVAVAVALVGPFGAELTGCGAAPRVGLQRHQPRVFGSHSLRGRYHWTEL